MEVIRVYMLEVGDSFIRQGIEYIVYKITDRIYYKPASGCAINTFGLNSQERVQLISKK